MNKKLPLYLQSYQHYFKDNFKRSFSIQIVILCLFSLSAFAQGPGSLFVDAGTDINIECGQDPCTDITANFLQTFDTSSSNYTVTSIPYNPPFPFNGLANSLNPDIDDAWSPVDNLPFDFCYFGNIETEFQVGSNGVIRFDVDPGDTGGGSNAYSFDSDIPNNVEEALAEANVFLPGHDIDPSVSSTEEIGYEVLGTFPNRVLVVSYYEVPMYSLSCNSLLATQMVVFYEFSNVIEIYMQDKPSCPGWNFGNAALGIQNNDGNIAFVPPGRNTSDSPWTTTNEAWSFSPAGAPTYEFAWLDSGGNVIGTDPTINVCPDSGGSTYTARATYTNCNGDVVVLTDEILVTKSDLSMELGPDLALCDTPSYEIIPEITGDPTGATYLWSPGGETTPTITVTSSDTYTLEITQGLCVISDSVNILFLTSPDCTIEPICEGVDFEENFGTGTGRVSTPFTNYVFNGTTQVEDGEYTISNTSAGLNTGWFTDMEDHTEGDVDGRMLFVNASFAPDEFYRRTISLDQNIEYTFNAWITTVYDTDTNICGGNSIPSNVIFRIEDPSGNLIAETNTGDIPNGPDPNWQEFAIVFNTGANTDVQLVLINNSIGGCGNDLALDDITLSLQNQQPEIVTPPDISACDVDGNGTEIFNLEDQIATILNGQDPTLFNTSFHLSQFDADANQNPIVNPDAYTNTTNPETIYVRVEKAAEPTCFNTVFFQLIVSDLEDLSGNLPAEVILCLGDDFPLLDATPSNPDIDLTIVTYEWTDGSGTVVSTDATYLPTAAGTYSVTITYPPCSEQTFSVEIIVNDPPIVDLGEDEILCNGSTFEIIPEITGDTTGITYLWSTGETTPTITVTESGTYSLEVTVGPCTASDSIDIIISDPVIVDLGEDFSSCFDTDTVLTANLEGNPQTATYEWLLNGIVLPGETNQTLLITEPGTYSVNATVDSCIGTDSVVVGLGNIEVTLDNDFQTCFESPVVLEAELSVQNPAATYEWSLDGTIITGEINSTLLITEIGTYTVTATVGSCSASDSVMVSFRDDLEVSLGADFLTCPNEPQTLTATTLEEGATYQWFLNGTLLTGETNGTLNFMVEPGTMGTQTYSVIISVGGCSGTDSIDVSLYAIDNCVISEGLSPNGDGYNDSLDLTFLNDRSGNLKLQIFNRLGALVFERNNYTNEWYGQTKDGNDLPTGTYFYVIDLEGNDAYYGSQATGWIYLNQEAN
ncbi:MAG: gliding motility-associated C-terminal domain-containing protein [Aequorivita sp.]|nr:gliding motility-associated C-terminal domain-containing protein [Aequorivita sp.]